MKSKLLIWGTGREYEKHINSIRYQELLGKIDVLGVTSEDGFYRFIDGYKYYKVTEALQLDFDYLVVATARNAFMDIVKVVGEYGIGEERIIKSSLFDIPEFDVEKYAFIRRKRISIISKNCWGGYLAHRLELPFNSPFVNMSVIEDGNYLKLLKNFKQYLKLEPVFDSWIFHNKLQAYYPRFSLGDIKLEGLHYETKEDFLECWRRRVERINYDELFVMMYTTSEEMLREFDELPFSNKVCFVPFHTNIESGYTLELYNKLEYMPFCDVVNGSANGRYKIYDVLELLSGKREERSITL